MTKKHILLFSTLFIILSNVIDTQKNSIIRCLPFSQTLQEGKILEVILPNDYKSDPGTKYEVLYLLDGEWNIKLIPFIHGFARSEGFLQRNVVFGNLFIQT